MLKKIIAPRTSNPTPIRMIALMMPPSRWNWIPSCPTTLITKTITSGRKALFINEGFTKRVVDMDEAAGKALLDELNTHATQPEFIYRHQWRPGDLVIMDNRSQMHVGHPDYDFSEGRILHRVIVKGDVPH